ncbi:MAG TPA: DEAD/DEAH box helicase [Fimbriimonadaceae bacterium]|nr:DEAD/DEAH box helicase [Fimbriimonadaceae bacterium]
MDSAHLASSLGLDEVFAGQITHVAELPEREARFGDLVAPMHPRLQESLAAQGIAKLYSHQTAAYNAASEGKDLVVVTGTNSGKTLCYNLPAIQACLTEPACRAFYLFPTKALAQDQRGKLEGLLPGPDIRCGTYDGDTPPSQRGPLRRLAHIILTNPDMLHVGILPGHEHWSKFLKSLRLIVLDEMHVYRGVFGSHVGCILRRLLRLCEWHRNRPQIIACSATIGNPVDLFQKLTGRTPHLINDDGSPKARRTFVFWNPPKIDEINRASANVVSSEIMATLAESGLRSLTFSRARVSTELVLRYARERVARGGVVSPEKIESYRAGYTPKERRQIEAGLFKGKLLALSATNAMELGVDVGGLDAVVMNGYPGSISSFWQQAGRAGRGSRPGLAIMVAHDDPLEQFLIREPHLLLESAVESVSANPANPQILSAQLKCAAHERALAPSELEAFGEKALQTAEAMDRSGEMEFRAGRFFYPSHEPPAPLVNIRGAGGDTVSLILDDGTELGTMERWRALQSAHEGAVYLHRGSSFVVDSFDPEKGESVLTPAQVSYYTQAITQSVIETQVVIRSERWGLHQATLEGIKVTDLVTGYKKKSLDGDTILGVFDLDLPPSTFETLAVRLDLPFDEIAGDPLLQAAGLHGLEHALMAVAPLFAGCDRGDLGSAWYAMFPETLRPALFVFDRTPGGVGLAEKLIENVGAWSSAAYQLLASCDCQEGCPGCLLSARCEANNETLDKTGALELLRDLKVSG